MDNKLILIGIVLGVLALAGVGYAIFHGESAAARAPTPPIAAGEPVRPPNPDTGTPQGGASADAGEAAATNR